MRFSSSVRKKIVIPLAAICLLDWVGGVATCRAVGGERVLLLKYSAPSISEETARSRFSVIAAEIERRLDVRPSLLPRGQKAGGPVLAGIDDARLNSIASRISETSRMMDRLENREAERQLSSLEKELRLYRVGDATRPLLADVFLKRATISLWDGDSESAKSFLKKARSLRPAFEPNPALYSPQFRQIWSGIGSDVPGEADILVDSVPSGARIFVDDSDRGTTPQRLKLPASRPVRLRLEHPGYQSATETRQWLAGDSERVEVQLPGDREARLSGFLEKSGPDIREAAPIVSEMASESGASLIVFLMLDLTGKGEELRVLAASASSPTPRSLGSIAIESGTEGLSSAASRAAGMLVEAGWPARTGEISPARRPWYYRWWFISGLGLLAAGAAVALSGGGGGGGGGGTSSSSSGVNF